jgi:transcriptional regulator with XRE-family HTH domain
MPHIDNRLGILRVAAGLTKPQLAVAIGVDPATIHRWESRTVGIPDHRKVELALMFGVSVPYLMCWDDENGNGGEVAA